jgi:hypothetical protein
MPTVHSVKIVGTTADGSITFVGVGNLTEHDASTPPPEVGPPEGGTPEHPIYKPPPAPTPHK